MIPARWTMDNGLKVLYQGDPAFPLASATLLLDVGSRHERLPQAGLCSMTIDLLMQGTRRRTARELAAAMESVGASMGTQVHEDYSELGFLAPAAELDRAFKVMAEALTQPAFPKEEIIKEKAHVLAALASRRDSIFNVAYDALNRAMYGEHAYGRLVEGTDETVRRFRRPDFQVWHREYARPGHAILSIIGPQSKTEARRLIEKNLGRWNSQKRNSFPPGGGRCGWGGTGLVLTPHLTPPPQGGRNMNRQLILRSHFKQAYLMAGYPAPRATDPDHIPLKVLNTLMGGGMSSRLFTVLREEAGLAYEVSSFYPTRLEAGQWVIYLGLPKEKLETASRRLDGLLKQLAERGPAAEEVRQAKAMIRGAFLMDRQSHRRQAWYQAWWEFLGRGANYGEEFLAAVDAVTPKQLHALAQKILRQPRVTVRVVPK
jgi:predicted Zn-dependent peptidase